MEPRSSRRKRRVSDWPAVNAERCTPLRLPQWGSTRTTFLRSSDRLVILKWYLHSIANKIHSPLEGSTRSVNDSASSQRPRPAITSTNPDAVNASEARQSVRTYRPASECRQQVPQQPISIPYRPAGPPFHGGHLAWSLLYKRAPVLHWNRRPGLVPPRAAGHGNPLLDPVDGKREGYCG